MVHTATIRSGQSFRLFMRHSTSEPRLKALSSKRKAASAGFLSLFECPMIFNERSLQEFLKLRGPWHQWKNPLQKPQRCVKLCDFPTFSDVLSLSQLSLSVFGCPDKEHLALAPKRTQHEIPIFIGLSSSLKNGVSSIFRHEKDRTISHHFPSNWV